MNGYRDTASAERWIECLTRSGVSPSPRASLSPPHDVIAGSEDRVHNR